MGDLPDDTNGPCRRTYVSFGVKDELEARGPGSLSASDVRISFVRGSAERAFEANTASSDGLGGP